MYPPHNCWFWYHICVGVISYFYCLYFLICFSICNFLVYIFGLSFFVYRISFNVCFKAGLVVLNSLSFCLSVKFFISLLNLNESLAGESILNCKFFPFTILNILCHSFLTCRISVAKSAYNLTQISLYVIYCFILVAFNIFSLSLSVWLLLIFGFLLGFILIGTVCTSWIG